MAISVMLMGDSGAAPETVFSTTVNKIVEFLVEEWCHVPPIDFQTLRICAIVHRSGSGSWWPYALLRQFMFRFPLFWQFSVDQESCKQTETDRQTLQQTSFKLEKKTVTE